MKDQDSESKVPSPWGSPKMFHWKPIDSKKRNEFVITMKGLFGDEKVYDYVKMHDENSELSQ